MLLGQGCSPHTQRIAAYPHHNLTTRPRHRADDDVSIMTPCHRSPEQVMSSLSLSGRKVAVLATDGFEQSELTEPKRLLEEAGAQVSVVAPGDGGKIKGWNHKDWGEQVTVDQSLVQANADDFDALVLPGGVMNPDRLRQMPEVVAFVQAFSRQGKPIAAICHGPWTLINAGLVKGRKLTSWPSLRQDLENAGATWVDEEVVADGQLITSRNPDDIPAFSDAVIKALAA
jgi:protease I